MRSLLVLLCTAVQRTKRKGPFLYSPLGVTSIRVPVPSRSGLSLPSSFTSPALHTTSVLATGLKKPAEPSRHFFLVGEKNPYPPLRLNCSHLSSQEKETVRGKNFDVAKLFETIQPLEDFFLPLNFFLSSSLQLKYHRNQYVQSCMFVSIYTGSL